MWQRVSELQQMDGVFGEPPHRRITCSNVNCKGTKPYYKMSLTLHNVELMIEMTLEALKK